MFFRQKNIIVLLILISLLNGGCNSSGKEPKQTETPKEESVISEIQTTKKLEINLPGNLSKIFNDSNAIQLETAKKLGIDPINGIHDAYFLKRPIIKIESNDNYRVDNLTYSVPYLVPEASALLEDIGHLFVEALEKQGIKGYRILVTSLLRTPVSVADLRKININASENSTHQYGTTFDISYSRFFEDSPNIVISEEDLKNLLGTVLNELRNEGRCYVKYETKTACFHITARK